MTRMRARDFFYSLAVCFFRFLFHWGSWFIVRRVCWHYYDLLSWRIALLALALDRGKVFFSIHQ